jgi:hypothetical protein
MSSVLVACVACSSSEPQAAPSEESVPEAPTTTYAPQDLELVPVQVAKPAPGTKVDPASLPEDLKAPPIGEITEPQQECINAAMKQALDADPSLGKTPGKRASLTSNAMAACDATAAFTDPIIEQLKSGGNPGVPVNETQAACLKQAFATDKLNTAKLIGNSLVMVYSPTGDLAGL